MCDGGSGVSVRAHGVSSMCAGRGRAGGEVTCVRARVRWWRRGGGGGGSTSALKVSRTSVLRSVPSASRHAAPTSPHTTEFPAMNMF
jgi:hypothetical protein